MDHSAQNHRHRPAADRPGNGDQPGYQEPGVRADLGDLGEPGGSAARPASGPRRHDEHHTRARHDHHSHDPRDHFAAHDHADPAAQTALAELLDLDAEVLREYLAEVTGWIHDLAAEAGHPVRRILDLGAGTGTGTLALLRRFPEASATALDLSTDLLARLRAKAAAPGLAGRVTTVVADLDSAWPDLVPVDLIWASASVHHLADPDRVLAEARDRLTPGGLFALAEMDGFPRFLPDDLGPGTGAPGLETRLHEARTRVQAHHLPDLGADWGPRLAAAGFEPAGARRFEIGIESPLEPAAIRYAEASYGRLRDLLADELAAEDLRTLDALLDTDGPRALRRRSDLMVRVTRPVWIGRRA